LFTFERWLGTQEMARIIEKILSQAAESDQSHTLSYNWFSKTLKKVRD